MKNVSINMEPLELRLHNNYLVIDVLYFNNFKSAICDINSSDYLKSAKCFIKKTQ